MGQWGVFVFMGRWVFFVCVLSWFWVGDPALSVYYHFLVYYDVVDYYCLSPMCYIRSAFESASVSLSVCRVTPPVCEAVCLVLCLVWFLVSEFPVLL